MSSSSSRKKPRDTRTPSPPLSSLPSSVHSCTHFFSYINSPFLVHHHLPYVYHSLFLVIYLFIYLFFYSFFSSHSFTSSWEGKADVHVYHTVFTLVRFCAWHGWMYMGNETDERMRQERAHKWMTNGWMGRCSDEWMT